MSDGRSRISTREALRFLTDASRALASSLDYQTTLQTVAGLAVPRVGCYCLVDIIEESEQGIRGERVRRFAVAHIDPEKEEVLRRTADNPREVRPGLPLDEVLRTGEPMLVERVTDEWLERIASGPEQMRRIRDLGTTSFIMAPLLARGQMLGVLGLGSTRTDRFYGERDLALAAELARIAALSIDNARLYAESQRAIRARDEVLGIVSHDLRNPVGTVFTAASMLLDLLPAEEDGIQQKNLRIIRRSAERANRLIQDLLDVTRIEAGRLPIDPAPVSAGTILLEARQMLEPLAADASLEIATHTEDDLPMVIADQERVLQVFSNLGGNAIKFTPAGGRITLRASHINDGVRFSVADTGSGIPPEQLPHLWNRFWQAQHGDRRGAGLGLAIVRGIIEAHGGEISVDSTLGRGARFGFTLPLADVKN